MPESVPVQLYVYDLTNGMARALSPMLLGREVEGVWHTGLVVHNTEWLFGQGVQRAMPGTTPFGQPLKKLDLGRTSVSPELVKDMVHELGRTQFRPQDYNLLHNNCNHFSNALSTLLTGSGIPEEYLTQHEVLLTSPMGQMLMPILTQMEAQLGSVTAEGVTNVMRDVHGTATASSTSTSSHRNLSSSTNANSTSSASAAAPGNMRNTRTSSQPTTHTFSAGGGQRTASNAPAPNAAALAALLAEAMSSLTNAAAPHASAQQREQA